MTHILTLMLMAVGFFATGCAQEHIGDNDRTLAGTDWRLTAWSVSSLHPMQFTITASFDDSRVSGMSVINSYGGIYSSTRDGDFKVADLQSTLMAGPADAMRAEAIYFDLLKQVSKCTLNNTTLTLLDSNNNELLIFTKR